MNPFKIKDEIRNDVSNFSQQGLDRNNLRSTGLYRAIVITAVAFIFLFAAFILHWAGSLEIGEYLCAVLEQRV